MVEKKRRDWIIWTIIVVAVLTLGSLYIWLRLARSFDFVSKFGGEVVPYPIKTDLTAKRLQNVEKETLCYAFKGDPKVIGAAIQTELTEKGWHWDEGMEGLYMRADFQKSEYGIPSNTFSTVYDYAVFEDDNKDLNVRADITCVFVTNRRTNFSEIYYRFTHRGESEDSHE